MARRLTCSALRLRSVSGPASRQASPSTGGGGPEEDLVGDSNDIFLASSAADPAGLR